MTPDFTIAADNIDATAIIRDRLISMTITDKAGNLSDSLQLVLDDRDHAIALPRTGAELSVALGYKQTGLVDMGKWTVDSIEMMSPPQTMTISAHAANLSSAATKSGKANTLREPKTRAWDHISIADIVASIAETHGYTPRVAAKYATGAPPMIGAPVQHLDQHNESDLNFLTRIAKQYGAVCKPIRDFLIFVEKNTPLSVTGRVLDGVNLTPKLVRNWRVSIHERGKYVAATAYYHDIATASRLQVRVGSVAGSPITTVIGTFADKQAAIAAADARLKAVNRITSLSINMQGNAFLASGTPISLSGFRQGADMTYTAESVTHTLNKQGFVTTVDGKA